MPDLSWSQWFKLGIGGAGLMKKHAASVPALRALLNDALDLWQEVVPAEPSDEPTVPAEVVAETIRTEMTKAERTQFDRASQVSDL